MGNYRTNRRTRGKFIATMPESTEAIARSFAGPVEMQNKYTGEEGFLYQGIIMYKGGPLTREEEVQLLVDSGMSDEQAIRAVVARRASSDMARGMAIDAQQASLHKNEHHPFRSPNACPICSLEVARRN